MAPCSKSFVYDGPRRLEAALKDDIRAVVLAEFEARLASASWLKRFFLKWEIEREIERRWAELNAVSPSEQALD